MANLLIKFIVACSGMLLIWSAVYAAESDQDLQHDEIDLIEKLFKEKNRDYPGCVFIVRDEVEYIDINDRAEAVPRLLDICIKGRSIGEKRVRKMYEIDPKKDKPKNKLFRIRVVPLDEVNDGKDIPYNW
ncbi:MAG: hypothetical protein ACI9BW_002500 [Gammaproteobacteria bacterium]|jgi:hypothetical protein